MSEAQKWDRRRTVEAAGYRVTLSTPVLVRRSRRYNWLPQLHRMANGDLLATMGAHADTKVTAQTKFASRSQDGGLTWDEPRVVLDGGSDSLTLPSGELLLLPRLLRRRKHGMGAPCNRLSLDGVLHYEVDGVTVYGVPGMAADAVAGDASGLCFDGQPQALPDGGYLATLNGPLGGRSRHTLAVVESADGYHWTYRSTVADHACPLPGSEGPDEAMLCRLCDGRLMCVFRLQSDEHGMLPFGQCWSNDEGETWSEPVAMNGPRSVEPSLVVMDDGAAVLSSGRPGVNLWINADGNGVDWSAVDIAEHHTACHPADPITKYSLVEDEWWTINTTGYTEIVSLGGPHLLMIYDRLAKGWDVIRDGEDESNSVWVVRVTIEPGTSNDEMER
jgi:hypothetical protein